MFSAQMTFNPTTTQPAGREMIPVPLSLLSTDAMQTLMDEGVEVGFPVSRSAGRDAWLMTLEHVESIVRQLNESLTRHSCSTKIDFERSECRIVIEPLGFEKMRGPFGVAFSDMIRSLAG